MRKYMAGPAVPGENSEYRREEAWGSEWEKVIMRRGNLIGQGQPKAHGADGGSRSRGWLLSKASTSIPRIASTVSGEVTTRMSNGRTASL